MVPATCFEGSKTVRGNLALTSGVIVNPEKCSNLINRKRRLCRVLGGPSISPDLQGSHGEAIE